MDENSSDYRIKYLLAHIPTDIVLKFEQLKTHKGRFRLLLDFVIENAYVWAHVQCSKKDFELSNRLRSNGDESYSNGQYDKAVQEFTESILYAVDGSEELAIGYANRSAALFSLGKYKDCLEDIDRALNLSCPDRFKTTLYKRRGDWLMQLGRPGANSSFTQALLWLDKSILSEADRNEAKILLMTLILTPYEIVMPPEEPFTFRVPEILQPNQQIPSASDAIRVTYSQEYHRHIVATRAIRPGEFLLVEKPFCRRLRPQSLLEKCSECIRESWSMIPCPFCVYAAYCSEACRYKAWDEYHEVECPVVGLLLSLDIGNTVCLGLRMAIIAAKKGKQLDTLWQEATAADINTNPAKDGYCLDGRIHSDQFLSVRRNFPREGIERFSVEQQICGLISIAVAVCFLATKSKFFGSKLKLYSLVEHPDVTFIGGIIFKQLHLEQARIQRMKKSGANALRASSSVFGDSMIAVGSLFNHSCDANTIHEMRSEHMVIVAAHPIEKDQQVFVNYGLDWAIVQKCQRMEYFKAWCYKCNCLACTEDWTVAVPSYKVQPLGKGVIRRIGTAVRNFSRCKFGTAQDRLDTINKLVNLIEILFAYRTKPCRELLLTTQLMKLCHVGEQTAQTKEQERHSYLLKSFQLCLLGKMEIHLLYTVYSILLN